MNIFKKKPRQSLWELQPSDLPPPSMIEREPFLEGLERNAVFRMMTFMNKLGQGVRNESMLSYSIIASIGRFWFSQNARLNSQCHLDLYLSGARAEEYIQAMLGRGMAWKNQRVVRSGLVSIYVLSTAYSLGYVGGIWSGAGPDLYFPLAAVVTLLIGWPIGLAYCEPYPSILAIAAVRRFEWAGIAGKDSRRSLVKGVGRILFLIPFSLLMVVGVGYFTGVSMIVRGGEATPLSLVSITCVSAIAGPVAGGLYGFWARRRRSIYLKRAIDDLREIFQAVQPIVS